MALVGVQYVISIGLIVAALFVGLQNRYLRRYPTGYDRNRVVVVSLTSGALERRDALVGALKSRAEIEEVAFAFQRFGAEENFSGWARPYRDRGDISFRVLIVTPEFLRVLGVRPSEGRDFSDADPLREQGTYIFNQTARRRWTCAPATAFRRHAMFRAGARSRGSCPTASAPTPATGPRIPSRSSFRGPWGGRFRSPIAISASLRGGPLRGRGAHPQVAALRHAARTRHRVPRYGGRYPLPQGFPRRRARLGVLRAGDLRLADGRLRAGVVRRPSTAARRSASARSAALRRLRFSACSTCVSCGSSS